MASAGEVQLADAALDDRIKALSDVRVEDVAAMYTLGDELGRGRFSVVQAATHKVEGSRYAVKVVENITLDDEENLEALETEIKILRQLSHPHIVQLKEVVHTAENTYIVMELLSGGGALRADLHLAQLPALARHRAPGCQAGEHPLRLFRVERHEADRLRLRRPVAGG